MPMHTGETYSSLQYIYRIPAQTIGKIVPETCEAITKALQHHLQVLNYLLHTTYKAFHNVINNFMKGNM